MKRPQFGIRLMLLVVALFATIFGWRAAVEFGRQEERKPNRKTLRMIARMTEQWTAELKDNPGRYGWTPSQTAEELKRQEKMLNETKAAIEQTPE
jgi:hypothetical protein